MSEWISVNVAVPHDNINVILDGGVGDIRNGDWWTVTGERFPGKLIQWSVTDWMPIPELPEGRDE